MMAEEEIFPDQPEDDDHELSSVEPKKPASFVIRIRKVYVVVVLVAVASFAGGYFTRDFLSAPPPLPEVAANPADPPTEVVISVDDDPSIGPEDAPITIIEFSDYECPFCKRFRDQTLDQILEVYEGQIRFVYRDFPLNNIHPRAQKAAEAAECADDQGRYWLMHDILFAEHPNWSKAADASESFKSYAAELQMDTDQFNQCLDTGKYTAEVQKDLRDGIIYGVSGTPAFFINGKPLSGAVPFEMFQTFIDAEM